MKKLQIGIIGTGFIGPVHAEAIRRNPELAELKAISGISEEDAADAAARLNIPYHTGDYKKIIGMDDIDVIHICTPNFLHYPMVRECLLSGKNVLCEKPLALTSEEAGELMRLAEEKKLKGAVNYNLRYYPMVQEMKALNREKGPGDIFALQGSYLQDWLLYETDYSWRLESKMSGKSRAVADIGTHWMDLAQYITGLKIKSVYARFGRMHDSRKKSAGGRDLTFNKGAAGDASSLVSYDVDTEDYAQIMFSFESGVMGSLAVSQVSAGYKNFMEYRQFGRDVSFVWDSESPNSLKIGHRDKANEILVKDPSLLHERPGSMSVFPGGHQEGYGETFRHMLREFYSDLLNINDDCADYPTLVDGTTEMALCEAVIKSVELDLWVDVATV